ncbi:phage portal protein [Gordonia sp. ABSL49_1]|nr:phage portal protein [Gordonia sp. ABSL49_1]MCH5645153.1 phage portal protein [Gordonia sp. ABSL49_1]
MLAERIGWDGWLFTGSGGIGDELARVFTDNALDVEQSAVTLDALIAGMGFVAVGTGTDGEPDVLVTGESPDSCTGLWDPRARRDRAALAQTYDGRVLTGESLYLPNQTIVLEYTSDGRATIVDRDVHNLGRVPVVRFANQERTSKKRGRSEITPPIRYYCDATARTLLGMEINREFYTAPQRYGLGVDPEQFGITQDMPKSERVRKGWEASMVRMNFIPYDDENDVMPQVGQFTPAPPTPYLEQIKGYAQRIASAAGIPHTYMGFTTDNPPSGDSIRMLESRLTRRAAFRQRMFGRSWREVARLVLMMQSADGSIDEDAFARIAVNWQDPSTPTPAADADRTVKLVGAKVLPANSDVTYREAGFSEVDIKQLEQDRRSATVRSVVSNLAAAAQAATQPSPQSTDTVDGRQP